MVIGLIDLQYPRQHYILINGVGIHALLQLGTHTLIQNRSMKELEYLFDAQWKNGMIPHIVFNEEEKTYFPTAEYYEITRSPNSPKHIGTSGMT